MDNLFNTFLEYYNRKDFRKFQNDLSLEVHKTLEASYLNRDNEVAMVTEMCNTINNKKFEKLKFYGKKIHGSKSYVDFHRQNKQITKELADMVIISVATKNKEIIYEKTAFIQNKKETRKDKWKIDQGQLYLLQNFPTFKGNKGIFKKEFKDKVIFQNHSGTLGNYGLFQKSGEMVLINASAIFRAQQGIWVELSDIKRLASGSLQNDNGFLLPLIENPFGSLVFYKIFESRFKNGIPSISLPFLNTSKVSFNIYEFIRNWTLFNIGDVVSVYGKTADKDLSIFNRFLLREVGLSDSINLGAIEQEFEPNMGVFVAHLDLDKEN